MVKRKKKKSNGKLDVLITEHSALKRKIAIETFRKNGYKKIPYRGSYQDQDGYWLLLRKGKVQVVLTWS